MSDNDVSVKIGAETAGLKSGMQEASQSVHHAMGEINQSLLSSITIGTTLGGILGNVLVGAFDKLTESIGEAITGTAAYYGEAAKLGRAMGTTASEAATLMQQLDDIQVSTDEYTGAAKGLEKQIAKNETGLNKMGLATRDAHGNLRPLNELMQDAIDITNRHKEGTDRNVTATQLFGKGIADGSKLLKMNAESAEEARKVNEELNLTIGVEGAANASAYKKAMQDVHDVTEGFKKTIGDALLPVLTQLGEWFRSAAPNLILGFKGAIGGVVATIHVLIFTIKMLADVFFAAITVMINAVMSFGSVFNKLMHGDVSGAWDEAKKGAHTFVADVKDGFNAVRDDAEETNKKIAHLFMDDPAQKKKQNGGTEEAETKQPKGKEVELMGKWKEALNEKIRDENGFFKDSTAMELAYWEQKASIAKKGSKDWLAVQKEIYTLQKKEAQDHLAVELDTIKREMAAVTEAGAERVRLSHEAAIKIGENYGLESKEYTAAMAQVQSEMIAAEARRVELAKLSSTIVMESKLAELEFEQQSIEQSFAMGETNNTQRLTSLKKLEEKKFQIEQQAALDAAKLIHDDVLAQTKAYADIEKAKKAHELAMKKLDDQVTLEKNKNLKSFIDSTKAGFQNALAGMLNGTMTFGNAIKSIFASIGQSLANIFSEIAANWLKEHVIMKVASVAFAKIEVMLASMMAGANGVASMALAPFPADTGAPAFGRAMNAIAGGFTPSAAGGFDIPAGTNPLTQLHEKEMVLPAKHADVIRGMAGGVGGTGMTVHIQAMDVKSFQSYLKTNSHAMAPALKALGRNFSPVK